MKNLVLMILTLLIFSSCSLDDVVNPDSELHLVMISSYSLSLAEPSDLSYDPLTNSLWTVSDNNNKVYNIDLEGNTIQELPFVGNDLEGIAYSFIDNSLWLAEEGDCQIVNITQQGAELAGYQIPLETGTNSGLEGICLLPDSTIALVKEKNPGKFVKLNSLYEVEQMLVIDFADDFSAISYNPEENFYWVLSDQNQALFAWTPEAGVIAEYSLPFEKPEGVCYVPDRQSFFFVSDSQNALYEMKLQ
ncbi:MAG: SdiA-regulated domain-containing protein [Candidatus Stygibacter frigidus]|nr:SdiA-regulated domain-containing protein [Candidatus Stygibacter frigidus]